MRGPRAQSATTAARADGTRAEWCSFDSKSYMPADGISAADGRMATSTRRYFFGSSRTNGNSCPLRQKRALIVDGCMICIGTSEQNCSLGK